jgi:hypothetical protein
VIILALLMILSFSITYLLLTFYTFFIYFVIFIVVGGGLIFLYLKLLRIRLFETIYPMVMFRDGCGRGVSVGMLVAVGTIK